MFQTREVRRLRRHHSAGHQPRVDHDRDGTAPTAGRRQGPAFWRALPRPDAAWRGQSSPGGGARGPKVANSRQILPRFWAVSAPIWTIKAAYFGNFQDLPDHAPDICKFRFLLVAIFQY